jgi:drug/metabolite transporter (DMT)-like permease
MAQKSSSRIDWFLFILLGFVWGSSYLFIKIGVDAGLPPMTLVMLRLLLGFALLAVVVGIAREPLPRDLMTYGHLIVMSVFSIVVPFSLITWAEQSVDSSLAAIINGAVPLFVIPFAAMFGMSVAVFRYGVLHGSGEALAADQGYG